MKFFGITRSNVVTSKTLGSFRATRGKTLEEAKRVIFNPKRLEIRASLFKNFCLPTYKMMAELYDQSYGIVLVNRDFPDPFKHDLKLMCESVPRIFLIEMGEEDSVASAARRVVRKVAGRDRFYTYRYDEDDALSKEYIFEVLRISETLPTNTVISFNNGYSLCRTNNEQYEMYVKTYPMNAFGLGVLSDHHDFKIAFGLGSHTQINLPTHHDRDSIGWLSTIHNMNDSRIGTVKEPLRSAQAIHADIWHLFPQISIEALLSLPLRGRADFSAPI